MTPRISDIQQSTAAYFNLPMVEFLSSRRSRCLVRPRQIGMYLCRRLTRRSLPEIGRTFGGRDHTTVLHGIRQIAAMLKADSCMRQDIEAIEATAIELAVAREGREAGWLPRVRPMLAGDLGLAA